MSVEKTTKPKVTKKVAVKKLTKKTIIKKVAPKKTIKVGVSKKTPVSKKNLIVANNQTSFWVKNGEILNSLVALRDSLEEMEKEVYLYHAGGNHNDFSNWIAAVLSDIECAEAIEKAKTPKSAKIIVTKHLKKYHI